jgi:DNA-directed RNA polymerase specialized sigma subunit
MSSLLEPEYGDSYTAWKTTPGPDTSAAFLQTIQPAMNSTIRTHIGDVNPIATSRARRTMLTALPQYNPAKASMRTFMYQQLQGLKRYHRQQGEGLKTPERVSFDRKALENYERELEHELGRAPSDAEISDRYGFSNRRLAKIRSYNPGVAEGTLERASGQVFGGVKQPTMPYEDEWNHYVYDQLDPVNQKIFEHTLGYNGNRKLDNTAIAKKLRITPGAVSQRKAKIQELLDQISLMEGL